MRASGAFAYCVFRVQYWDFAYGIRNTLYERSSKQAHHRDRTIRTGSHAQPTPPALQWVKLHRFPAFTIHQRLSPIVIKGVEIAAADALPALPAFRHVPLGNVVAAGPALLHTPAGPARKG